MFVPLAATATGSISMGCSAKRTTNTCTHAPARNTPVTLRPRATTRSSRGHREKTYHDHPHLPARLRLWLLRLPVRHRPLQRRPLPRQPVSNPNEDTDCYRVGDPPKPLYWLPFGDWTCAVL